MKKGSRLTVKDYHIREAVYGAENKITQYGQMVINKDILNVFRNSEPLIYDMDVRIIAPNAHQCHTNTIMDIIPLAVKALGKVGEGITHTATGVYVLLTGVDVNGRQVCNGGASDGILEDQIAWGMAGTPKRSDYLISFDVILKADAWTTREGPDAIHRVCDRFCSIFREQMRKFNGYQYTEIHHFQEEYKEGIPDVVIVKEVSGQGAVYDTRMFGQEPGSFIGGRSVIDMGCMPVIVTPNEYRDGIMRAMD